MPCATRNELDLEDAKSLPGNGVMVVCAGANKPLTAEDPADLTGPGAPIRLLEAPQLVLRSELAAPGPDHHLRIRRSRVHGGGLGRGEPSRQLKNHIGSAAPVRYTNSSAGAGNSRPCVI